MSVRLIGNGSNRKIAAKLNSLTYFNLVGIEHFRFSNQYMDSLDEESMYVLCAWGVRKPDENRLTAADSHNIKGALCGFGEENQTQNFNVYNIYHVIIQTQEYFFLISEYWIYINRNGRVRHIQTK